MANLPKRSKKHPYGGYETIVCMMLKPYKGYLIDKSAEYSEYTGNMIKDSIVYSISESVDDDYIDCFKTLQEAKRAIDSWTE